MGSLRGTRSLEGWEQRLRSLSDLLRFQQPVGDRTGVSVYSFLSPVTVTRFIFPAHVSLLPAFLNFS